MVVTSHGSPSAWRGNDVLFRDVHHGFAIDKRRDEVPFARGIHPVEIERSGLHELSALRIGEAQQRSCTSFTNRGQYGIPHQAELRADFLPAGFGLLRRRSS
jgi:hypothetical protein